MQAVLMIYVLQSGVILTTWVCMNIVGVMV